jgi:hypothetical protein
MPYVNYNKVTDWSKEKILEKLATDDNWVERALVALYKRQVSQEISGDYGVTVYENERGFQVADALEFTEYARQLLRGEHLNRTQLASCRRPWHRGKRAIPTIAKYRGQLLDMIEKSAKMKIEGAR